MMDGIKSEMVLTTSVVCKCQKRRDVQLGDDGRKWRVRKNPRLRWFYCCQA